ncbi:MAG: GGDEF domain-containing protein [Myxococcales bacterium]|nr:GGDEF domain-containing protein [Myxococcales bacterium]
MIQISKGESAQNKRPRIGVVVDALHESYQSPVWLGLSRAAEEMDVNLISFIATSQDRVDSFDVHYNIIADFVRKSDVAGVIVFAGSMAEHRGMSFSEDFCNSLGDVPIVCLSAKLANAPTVMVENGVGIHAMMAHFIQVHGYRNIVFVKGPEGHSEAETRFRAYCDALTEHELPFRSELVISGTFSERSGRDAVKRLLENNIPFDAVIAVDDASAFGAIAELKRRNIHVPTKVAVAGFDDVPLSQMHMPPLSTVRQPLDALGRQALLALLERLKTGKDVADVILPAEPVFRRSCGCFSHGVRGARSNTRAEAILDRSTLLNAMVDEIQPLLRSDTSSEWDTHLRDDVDALIDKLVADATDAQTEDVFLNEVDFFLFKYAALADVVPVMQVIIQELGTHIKTVLHRPTHRSQAADILQQAGALVREHRLRIVEDQHYQADMFQLTIRETSQNIITSFEVRRVLDTISDAFPKIRINSAVLALYNQNSRNPGISATEWSFPRNARLLLGFNQRKGIVNYNRGQQVFETAALAPDGILESDKANNYIFMPLFFHDEHFGFMLVEYQEGAPLFMFEELRLHVSSSLKSSFLMRELKNQSMLDELTGLQNRRGFVSQGQKLLDVAILNGQSLMLFYADLDGLKRINDTWGHEEGDRAIRGAASVLCETFREQDLIARIGGDEFTAILIVNGSPEMVEARIMERLGRVIEKYNRTHHASYALSMSMGASAILAGTSRTLDEIMREADDIMMERKRAAKAARGQ